MNKLALILTLNDPQNDAQMLQNLLLRLNFLVQNNWAFKTICDVKTELYSYLIKHSKHTRIISSIQLLFKQSSFLHPAFRLPNKECLNQFNFYLNNVHFHLSSLCFQRTISSNQVLHRNFLAIQLPIKK